MHTQKRLKRSLLLMICFILLVTIPLISATGVSADDFTDIGPDHWAYGYVDDVVSRGFFIGTSATTFSPGTLMTRAMFVTVLSRYANATIDNSIQTAFNDVPTGQYYTGAVAWGVSRGIINGRSETVFDPHGAITREEIVTIVIRLVDYLQKQLPQDAVWISFTDEGTISAYAKDPMVIAVQAKIIFGYPDGSVRPKGFATRAEVAAIVSRIRELLGVIDDSDVPLSELPDVTPPTTESPGGGGGDGGGGGGIPPPPPATYVVTYDANGGTGAPENQTKTNNITLTLSATAPTRTGYAFKGWNTAQDGSGTTYAPGADYTANEVTTLFAIWEINKYTVTFKDWDETVLGTAVVEHGSNATPPTVPTRTGYIFTSWSRDITNVTGDITAVAQYDPETTVCAHVPGAEATCTEPQVCMVCGEVLAEALGHDYETAVIPSTCLLNGYTTYTCSRCGDIEQRDPTPIDPGNHVGHDWVETVDPTCMDGGYDVYECACGDIEQRNPTSKDPGNHVGHDWVETVDPTCMDDGYDVYECACGDIEQRNPTSKDPGNHVGPFNAEVTTIYPLCTTVGQKVVNCDACHAVGQVVVIPALDHDWGAWVVTLPASYVNTGTETSTCTRCLATQTRVIPRLVLSDEEAAKLAQDIAAEISKALTGAGGIAAHAVTAPDGHIDIIITVGGVDYVFVGGNTITGGQDLVIDGIIFHLNIQGASGKASLTVTYTNGSSVTININ